MLINSALIDIIAASGLTIIHEIGHYTDFNFTDDIVHFNCDCLSLIGLWYYSLTFTNKDLLVKNKAELN
jgi:hypothetical protein